MPEAFGKFKHHPRAFKQRRHRRRFPGMRHLLGQNIAAAKRTAAVAAGKLVIAEKTVARRDEMRVLNPFLVKPRVDIQFHIVKHFFQHR